MIKKNIVMLFLAADEREEVEFSSNSVSFFDICIFIDFKVFGSLREYFA